MKILLFANTDWYLYNFRRGLVAALHDAGHHVMLVSPAGPYVPKLLALGVEWLEAPMQRRSLNPVRELLLVRWLHRVLISEQVHVVHAFTVKCAVYLSLAGRLAGVPGRINAVAGMGYVYTSNDLKARLLRPVVSTLLRIALGGRGARLVLQNPDDLAFFKSASLVNPSHIRLIPGSGVDCSRFSVRNQSVHPSRTRILLAARLLWDKGVDEYVHAARILRQRGLEADFLIAGTPDHGNPAAVPEALLKVWGEEGVIHWLGHVDDMPTLLHSVDAFVLPSYREGLPKGLIEAAACGLPLVTTDAPGCREVVTHGIDGLLVPSKNASALADAIAVLCEDRQLRRRLGLAARQKALRLFDEKCIVRQTLEVYRELGVPIPVDTY